MAELWVNIVIVWTLFADMKMWKYKEKNRATKRCYLNRAKVTIAVDNWDSIQQGALERSYIKHSMIIQLGDIDSRKLKY